MALSAIHIHPDDRDEVYRLPFVLAIVRPARPCHYERERIHERDARNDLFMPQPPLLLELPQVWLQDENSLDQNAPETMHGLQNEVPQDETERENDGHDAKKLVPVHPLLE